MRYDILIATRPHRHEQLCALLTELGRQMRPGVGVLVYRDDQQASYGHACHTLLHASTADYTAFFDDDDWPAGDYLDRVMAALETGPDYVGWPEIYTVDGGPPQIIIHSLHDRATEYPDLIIAGDIVHKNPIRRELALLGQWSGQWGADGRWAEQVRASGQVKTETWISEPVYYYRVRSADGALTTWHPHQGPLPALPSYDWLREL